MSVTRDGCVGDETAAGGAEQGGPGGPPGVTLAQLLELDWVPSFGCTEPAAVGYAAALARARLGRAPQRCAVAVDARMYKNGFAVGVPNSGGQVGLRWAAALGLAIGDPGRRLEIFREVSAAQLAEAAELVARGGVELEVEYTYDHLWLELTVWADGHSARVLVEHEHTAVARVEVDGVAQALPAAQSSRAGPGAVAQLRRELAALAPDELVALAGAPGDAERAALKEGLRHNRAIANLGLSLLPGPFLAATAGDLQSRVGRLAAAGVYARMAGQPRTVFAVGGSGNKGITASVPLYEWALDTGRPEQLALEAVALSLAFTSGITSRLGSLSAICGCSNAAGVGVACGLVHLQGGTPAQMHLAVNNMVGCIAGMICDGAKLGCALKTFASIDTAFRSATLALAGVGIPAVEGIVGASAQASLSNLGRLSRRGMIGTDGEILRILADKA